MSKPLIILTGLMYAYVAFEQLRLGNYGMFYAYCGYAFSNIGLYILAN
jgi:hypothetical protein